jgi:transcriptional regulator with XRE-family HTH domain
MENAIGQALRDIRESRGMTESDLSRASGIPTSTISRIEHGETLSPGIIVVARLCAAMRVSVDELLTRAGLAPGGQGQRIDNSMYSPDTLAILAVLQRIERRLDQM